jgi:hypothetical protein
MTGDDLPKEANVVHYVGDSKIDEGKVDGAAFRLNPGKEGLSVNWLEYFQDLEKKEQLNEVRRLSRLTPGPLAKLAELNVGETINHVLSELPSIRFVHTPLDATDEEEEDPSHSDIMGLPPKDSPGGRDKIIGDMIAECVRELHTAKL